MKKIKIGESIKCDNDKEYVCFFEFEDEGVSYVCLTTSSKPPEVKFAKYNQKDTNESLTIIGSKEEKRRVFEMLQKRINNTKI